MSTAREPCSNCQLPYYTERNSECPYCGMGPSTGDTTTTPAGDEQASHDGAETVETAPAGSVARMRPPERPRTTCSHCGLPHYADTGNGCPYCDTAGRTADAGAESVAAPASEAPETEPASGGRETTPATDTGTPADGQGSRSGQGSGGLLASLKRLVGR